MTRNIRLSRTTTRRTRYYIGEDASGARIYISEAERKQLGLPLPAKDFRGDAKFTAKGSLRKRRRSR